jgi:hypothetical protein
MCKNSPLLEPGEARGGQEEASCDPLQVGGSPEEPHVVGQVHEMEATVIRSPCCPLLLEG